MSKSKKTRDVFPVGQGDVRLRVKLSVWQILPRSTRTLLTDATSGVEKIRKEIALSAKVKMLPPVEVVGEVWMKMNEFFIDGRGTPLSVGGHNFWGVQIPSQTATHQNSSFIRDVLVHEFAHCFHMSEHLLNEAEKQGETVVLSMHHDVFDSAADDALLVKADDWFGEEDSKNFIHHDHRYDEVNDHIYELRTRLPVLVPDLHFKIDGQLSLHDETIEHIRNLKKQARATERS